jgi:ribonuclease BN (tRNA processing enzyme)
MERSDPGVLTHLHADHTFALPDLQVMGWVLGRTDTLEVHGPSGTSEMMTSMIRAVEPDIASERTTLAPSCAVRLPHATVSNSSAA